MIADAVFLLSGVVNVVLFGMTRRILPSDSINLVKWIRRRSQPQSQSMTGVSVTIELTRDSFTIRLRLDPLMKRKRMQNRGLAWARGRWNRCRFILMWVRDFYIACTCTANGCTE
ncbi:hypothetical protein R3P38DRAFT_3298650 [Favolaschia claudopus]|uniref:Uncharacterized protein n=1 Tax=Favolaschia claudopus TaxID=2862362 RepID=A0AAV9Z2I6_9AGAR